MTFGKSMTFDREEIGLAVSPISSIARAPDESAFIENLRSGNAAAFDLLVERYSSDIFALLFRLTENQEEAADLTQETFLRAFRSIKGFRGESGIKTWLFRIAINESRNRFRWWKRRRRDSTISLDITIGDSDTTLGSTLADNSVSPEDAAMTREREYAIKAALLDMPEIFREAVVLCDIEGLSYEETAEALGVNIGTVKSRISRGREELRRRLKDF
jgi:RNA polymerase sigma-70 factor (ECF subfamily)